MASIETRKAKDGSLRYRVRIRLKGAKEESASFKRLTSARAYARQVEGQIAEGRYFSPNEARRHTLADAIDRYLVSVLPHKKPRTIMQQRQQLAWWRDRIGHLRLSDVSGGLVIGHRDALCATTSNSTANRYMSALKHLLTVCVAEWQWLHESPLRHISRLREPRGRVRYLSDEERERLLAACRVSTHEHLYLIVLVALCTGCRRSEITRLTWPQVSPGRESLTLIDTKNGDSRRVPIVEPARSELQTYARTRRIVGIDWVFPGRSRRGPCDIGAAWLIALKAAGIDDFRFHDLRHTAASYLAMSGATPLEIAEALGHRDLNMVRRYAHLSESSLRGTLSRAMAKLFNESVC